MQKLYNSFNYYEILKEFLLPLGCCVTFSLRTFLAITELQTIFLLLFALKMTTHFGYQQQTTPGGCKTSTN